MRRILRDDTALRRPNSGRPAAWHTAERAEEWQCACGAPQFPPPRADPTHALRRWIRRAAAKRGRRREVMRPCRGRWRRGVGAAWHRGRSDGVQRWSSPEPSWRGSRPSPGPWCWRPDARPPCAVSCRVGISSAGSAGNPTVSENTKQNMHHHAKAIQKYFWKQKWDWWTEKNRTKSEECMNETQKHENPTRMQNAKKLGW